MQIIRRIAMAAALGLALGGTAQAESFTLFVYETPADLALRTDTGAGGQAYWAGYNQFAAALVQAGALRGGSALDSAGGPGHRDKVLGGYFVIDVPDMAAAKALAGQAPAAATVYIRRHAPNPSQAMTGAQ